MFYKFYAHFPLSIAPVVVWWSYGLIYVQLPAKLLLIIIFLPFITMPSIIVNSFFIGQYCLMPLSTTSFLCDQSCIIYDFSSWRYASSYVAVSMSCMDMQTGLFTDILMTFTLTLFSWISISSFSSWLFYDGQAVMSESGPGLYMMYILYWCIHGRMHCNCCDSICHISAQYSHQWLVISDYAYFSPTAVVVENNVKIL